MNNICICLTTFLRNELAFKTIQSIQANLNENIQLFIGDQNKEDNYINQNPNWHFTNYFRLPYDCGLSYARNKLIALANSMDYKYILLSADSIEFINKYDFNPYIEFLESNPKHALVGFQLNNRVPWEFNLRYVPGDSFYLEASNEFIKFKDLEFKKIDICKNFFLAKTSILTEIKWDNELKLQEHTDMFFRLKQAGYNCFYNSDIKANYIDFKSPEYKVMRDRMNKEYRNLFITKYNIKEWIKYSPEARKIFFEFNKKKKIGKVEKNEKMAWKIVSFYTINYQHIAEKYLIPSLKKLNIELYIVYIPNLPTWKIATDYKAQFCLDCLDSFAKDIVWIDCDATVNFYPEEFDFLSDEKNIDVAYHLLSWAEQYGRPKDLGKYEFCSGTLYFKNNKKVNQLVKKWIEFTKQYSNDQKALDNALKTQLDIKYYILHITYCYIESTPEGKKPATPIDKPIISHYQASRELR